MKLGIVYTSTTPELIDLVNKEVTSHIADAELLNYEDATILSEIREENYVTAPAAARLVGLYSQAIQDGAVALLNCCSSVGEVADSVQDFARFSGIPIVRIDEQMCREAVLSADRIAVMATLSSTLNPTKNTLLRVAREANRRIVLVDALVEGAFGLNETEFKARMLETARKVEDHCDLILFAQGSMAYAEQYIAQAMGKPVLSSPRFGAAALKEALENQGIV